MEISLSTNKEEMYTNAPAKKAIKGSEKGSFQVFLSVGRIIIPSIILIKITEYRGVLVTSQRGIMQRAIHKHQ